MITELRIKNYKSILDETISLGRINVFIGENGCGKTNILEAVAMLCASKDNDLSAEGLYNRGVRVTKPSLTFSSFLGQRLNENIQITLQSLSQESDIIGIDSILSCQNSNDIYSAWNDANSAESLFENATFSDQKTPIINVDNPFLAKLLGIKEEEISDKPEIYSPLFWAAFYSADRNKKSRQHEFIKDFIIFNLSTNALRGNTTQSKKQPLGIFGEGLDVLLANLDETEKQIIGDEIPISWMKDYFIDTDQEYKRQGHKIGRSTSDLYFKDKFMRRNNNVFAAENSNEGALYVLFYLTLFASKKTPNFFAIDNIESALNPKLCRDLMVRIVNTAKQTNKQALITTHNPAIIDGLDLNDDQQRLFVVKRSDEGFTKVERIQVKPKVKNQQFKLSELWMRGFLGGLSSNF
ncbi:MAG: AAA family ATPase [Bacteroidetes bacterium]|nr:AAA family ATPase [Bacteroidota bacterium]MBU1720155.1 AAA family ATPase [Bacteroidota bacterium]